jgi:hypothetical protein
MNLFKACGTVGYGRRNLWKTAGGNGLEEAPVDRTDDPDGSQVPRVVSDRVSPSSEFVCLNRVVGSPSRPPHMGDINSLDGDTG